MGHDPRHQSSSSGVLVAVVVVVLIVALVGVLAVLGAGYFFVRSARVEEMVARERVVAELRRVGEEAHRAEAEALAAVDEARVHATPNSRFNFEVKLDRKGNACVDGEKIDLDELKAQLVKLKNEASNALSVYINADPECPVKHIIPVLDVCNEIGDIDFRIASSERPETPLVKRDAEN